MHELDDLHDLIPRRGLLQRAGVLGLGALVTSALPVARTVEVAAAATPNHLDGTLTRNATAAIACGYRVMGLPGVAPNGYQRNFSYGKKLGRERTKRGYLP